MNLFTPSYAVARGATFVARGSAAERVDKKAVKLAFYQGYALIDIFQPMRPPLSSGSIPGGGFGPNLQIGRKPKQRGSFGVSSRK